MNVAAFLKVITKLPPRMRMLLAAAMVLFVLGATVALSVSHDNRVALFATPLHPEQLAEVQERLAQWNVPFTPASDNVCVSAARRSEVLLRLSIAGVPHEHIESSGEMLSKVSALTPQSVIDEQTRAGLAADLQLALRGIDGIQDATVIIAPAKPALFADEQSHDGSASVRLRLRPGARLSPNAISGMRAFVSAGVPGLDARHVTIVDDRGLALNDEGPDAVDAVELQASLQSALDAAFGPGSAIVRVHVDYDARTQAIKETRRIAGSALPISSEHSDELYSAGGKHYSKTIHSDDRGSDVREVQTMVAPGRVARVSVAIMVDAPHAADVYKIRSLAGAAAGLDVRRGDSLIVQAMVFHSARTPRIDSWFAIYGMLTQVLPPLVLGTLVLLGLKTFRKPAAALVASIAGRASLAQTRAAVAGFAPAQVRGALRDEPPHTAAAVISALPAATAAAVLDLYPPEERAAIIRRMSRSHSPLVPDFETIIANA
ncbi:MAG: hypothetical protein M3126_10375 [Candidatus Eremiobacteraeota bacterium]|nr:hypothetical protein [Candidatus Eremiobacteraeota bacterium]